MKIKRFISPYGLALFTILMMLLFIRIYNLQADPPAWKRIGDIFDEGLWVFNARNLVLFGKLMIDNFASWTGSPLLTGIWIITFKLMGVSFASARIVSAMLGFFTFLIIYRVLLKTYGRRMALFGLLFFGLNGTILMYSRLATIETSLIFFILIFLVLWRLGKTNAKLYFLSGAAFALACLTKINAVIFIPSFILIWLWENHENIRNRRFWLLSRPVIFSALGFSLIAIPYIFLIYLPRLHDYKMMYEILFYAQKAPDLAALYKLFKMRLFHSPGELIFSHIPVTLLLFFLYPYVLSMLSGPGFWIFTKIKEMKPFTAYAVIFLLSGWFFGLPFGFIDRRQFIFVIPMCLLASRIAYIRLFEEPVKQKEEAGISKAQLFILLGLFIYAIFAFIGIYCWRDCFPCNCENLIAPICKIKGRYLILYPIALSIALFFLAKLNRARDLIIKWCPLIIFVLLLILALFRCIHMNNEILMREGLFHIVPYYAPIYKMLIKLGLLLLVPALIFKKYTVKLFISKPAVIFLLFIYFAVNIAQIYGSVIMPKKSLYEESRRLGDILPKGAILVGSFALELAFENKAFPTYWYSVGENIKTNTRNDAGYYLMEEAQIKEIETSRKLEYITKLKLLPMLFNKNDYRVGLQLYKDTGKTIYDEGFKQND